MLTTKINKGIYQISLNGRVFETERYPDGSWLVFETTKGNREYIRDFNTLREVKNIVPTL